MRPVQFREQVASAGSSAVLSSSFGPKPLRGGVHGDRVKNWLQHSLERLCKRHLLRRGAYFQLKSFLPAPVLALVWLKAVNARFPFDVHELLNTTVTLRHLLLGVGTSVLWNVASVRKPARHHSTAGEIKREITLLVRSSVLCGLLLLVGNAVHASLAQGGELGLRLTGAFLIGSFLLLAGAFLASARVSSSSRSRKAGIIGSGPRAAALRALVRSSHAPLQIIGCLDDEYHGSDAKADNYLGNLEALADLLKAEPVEQVLIGLPVRSKYEQIQKVIKVCETIGVESSYMLDVFATTRNIQQSSAAQPQFTVLADPPTGMRHWVKRGLDVAIAGLMLLVASPVLLAIAIAVKLTSTGPIFFVQKRYGQNRQVFPMYKFRTMVVDAEARQAALESANEAAGPVFKLKADPRITKIGALLRKTSLDELPQLINVLKGEMSLVGPRPLPLRDVSRFDEAWLLRRFSVKPGLTCLWQVRGRSNTTFDQWIKLDLQYIDEWSLRLDMIILAQTIPAVLRGSGAM